MFVWEQPTVVDGLEFLFLLPLYLLAAENQVGKLSFYSSQNVFFCKLVFNYK